MNILPPGTPGTPVSNNFPSLLHPRIFVSHSHEDNKFCIKLVEDLRHALGADDDVWYDASGGLNGGDTWWRVIMDEIAARSVFIVVLSPKSVELQWINAEFNIARQFLLILLWHLHLYHGRPSSSYGPLSQYLE